MNRYFLALIALSLAAPFASAGAATDLASSAEAVYNMTIPSHRGAQLEGALAGGAYITSINLAGEAMARAWEEEAWDAAQNHLDPFPAYRNAALGFHQEVGAALAGELARLTQHTPVAVEDVDDLLIIAHMLAEAESSLVRSSTFLQASGHESFPRSEFARYSMARHTNVAMANIEAARIMLDGFHASSSGPWYDDASIEDAINAAGGIPPSQITAVNGGPMYRLARFTEGIIGGFREVDENVTTQQLETAVDALDRRIPALREVGFTGARIEALSSDTRWWIEHSKSGGQINGTLGWDILAKELHARVLGAQHEADLLTQSVGESKWQMWLLVAGGAGALGIGYYWHRRRGLQAQKSTSVVSRRARQASAALLLVMFISWLPAGSADSIGSDPNQVPVAFTEAKIGSGGGNAVIDASGIVHFAWHEVLQGDQVVLKYRTFDPPSGAWGPIVGDVVTVNAKAIQPHLTLVGDALFLHWMERNGPNSESPHVLASCWLQDGRCGQVTRHSDPAGKRLYAAAAASPDGTRLYLTWSVSTWSSTAAAYESTVHLRQYAAGAWGPRIDFQVESEDDRSEEQVGANVAVDAQGRAHVVWGQVPPISETGRGRAMYAMVTPGATSPSFVEEAVKGIQKAEFLRVAAGGGTIHLLYGAPQEKREDYVNIHSAQRVGGTWRAHTNISQVERTLIAWPDLVMEGSALVAYWTEATQTESFYLMAARFHEGAWGRPQRVLPDWGEMNLLPALTLQGQVWHWVWTGGGPGVENNQAHYHRQTPESLYAPPAIDAITPSADGWAKDVFTLLVRFSTDAPIDTAASSLSLDGAEHAFTISGNHLTADVAGLAEGPHAFSLRLRDTSGGEAQQDWAVHVDTTLPEFNVTTAEGAEVPEGWQSSRLVILMTPIQDDGAPVRVQVQFDRGHWAPLHTNVVEIPEGRMYQVRGRAIDAAGNIQLGQTFTIGWDDNSPNVQFQDPAAWSNGSVLVNFTMPAPGFNQPPGSPVQVNATLHLDGGEQRQTVVSPSDAKIRFDAVPEGVHQLWASARDAAGNGQGAINWSVRVDRTPPEIVSSQGRSVTVRDSGSGVAWVLVAGEMLEAGGAQEWVFDIPAEGRHQIQLRDVAGNVRTVVLDATGALLEALDEGSSSDSTPDQGAPGSSAAAAALVVIAVALRRRRGHVGT